MHAKTVVLVAGAGLAAAGSCPVTADPAQQLAGNSVFFPDGTDPYTPTKGVPFTIEYDGTGLGPTVDVVLGKGPATNVVPVGFIAKDVANCGQSRCKISWTPDCSLEDTAGLYSGYGLRVIDNASCKFQWTVQFGIKKGDVCGTTKPSSAASHPEPTSKGPKPSEYAEPSGKGPHKPSYTVSCDDESEPTGKPYPKPSGKWDGEGKSDYHPKPSGYSSGPSGTETEGYYPPKNGTAYQPPNVSGGSTKPSYTPLQSNDAAGRYAVSALGALVALATSFMLL